MQNSWQIFVKEQLRSDAFRFLGLKDLEAELAGSAAGQTLYPALPKLGVRFAQDPIAYVGSSVQVISSLQGNEAEPIFLDLSSVQNDTPAYSVEFGAGSRRQIVIWAGNLASKRGVKSRLFPRILVSIERNAEAHLVFVGAEIQLLQSHVEIELKAAGARVRVDALHQAQASDRHDLWLNVDHQAPETHSEIYTYSAADGKSHCVSNTQVTMSVNCSGSISAQKSKNLLLSDTAKADSFPKLFIFHDDVKASHGSSVSSLDPDQLVYLRSRGIDDDQARRMVIQGFVSTVIQQVQSPGLRSVLIERMGLPSPEEI